MQYHKTIVCLANSRKAAGRCIAGKEISNGVIGKWVRPVSDRPSQEISEEERRYKDGTDLHLLDIVTVPVEKAIPHAHQLENYLIDPNYYWKKLGELPWSEVDSLLDRPETFWLNGYGSYSGKNNRVPGKETFNNSLHFIRTDKITLLIGRKAPEYPDSKRAVRALFNYNGVEYLMDVTDPYIEQLYLPGEDGEYIVDSPYLCISLSEIYSKDGYCYKLVAAILSKEIHNE